MKIIDLLNRIANGEEVPKKIIYKGDCWNLKQKYANRLPYYSNGYDKDNLFTGEEDEYFSESLNDEVEIIEEDKKIEKLNENTFGNNRTFDEVDSDIDFIVEKVNEIIKHINNGD